ncbi:MAG: fumarylacetoacetate hydrolase family protein [Actinomycetota bacterium]
MTDQTDASPRIAALTDLLLAARAEARALPPLDPDLIPVSDEEAEAVDDAVAAAIDRPVVGWKIGCTSEHAQALLGADGPFAGRVYDIHDSGVTLEPEQFVTEPVLEGEIAFTFGASLPPRAEAYTRDEIVAAVAAARPAIEVVGGRFEQFMGSPLRALIADAGANTRLVLGDPVTEWDPDGLVDAAATMTVDGEVTGSGHGRDVLGDPITALGWLVNRLAGRGITVEAGTTVTTGTVTQVSSMPPGSEATNTVEGLGSVTARRAP